MVREDIRADVAGDVDKPHERAVLVRIAPARLITGANGKVETVVEQPDSEPAPAHDQHAAKRGRTQEQTQRAALAMSPVMTRGRRPWKRRVAALAVVRMSVRMNGGSLNGAR